MPLVHEIVPGDRVIWHNRGRKVREVRPCTCYNPREDYRHIRWGPGYSEVCLWEGTELRRLERPVSLIRAANIRPGDSISGIGRVMAVCHLGDSRTRIEYEIREPGEYQSSAIFIVERRRATS